MADANPQNKRASFFRIYGDLLPEHEQWTEQRLTEFFTANPEIERQINLTPKEILAQIGPVTPVVSPTSPVKPEKKTTTPHIHGHIDHKDKTDDAPDEDTLLALAGDDRYKDIIRQSVAGWNEQHPEHAIREAFIKDAKGQEIINPEVIGDASVMGKIPDLRHLAFEVYKEAYGDEAVKRVVTDAYKKAESDPLYRSLMEKIQRNPSSEGRLIDDFVKKYPNKARGYMSSRKFSRGSKEHKIFQAAWKRYEKGLRETLREQQQTLEAEKKQKKAWDKEFRSLRRRDPTVIHGGVKKFHDQVEQAVQAEARDPGIAESIRKREHNKLFSERPTEASYLMRHDKNLRKEYERWKKEQKGSKNSEKQLAKIRRAEDDPRFQTLVSEHTDRLMRKKADEQAAVQRSREEAAEKTHGLIITRSTGHHDVLKDNSLTEEIKASVKADATRLAADEFVRNHPNLAKKYARKNNLIKQALAAFDAEEKEKKEALQKERFGRRGFLAKTAAFFGFDVSPNKLSGIVLDKLGKRIPDASFVVTRNGKTLRRGSTKKSGSYATFLPYGTFTATFTFEGASRTYKVRFRSLKREPKTATLVVRLDTEYKKPSGAEEAEKEEKAEETTPQTPEEHATQPSGGASETKQTTTPGAGTPENQEPPSSFRERLRQRYRDLRGTREPSQTPERPRFRSPVQRVRERGRETLRRAGRAIDGRLGSAGSRLGSRLNNFRNKIPGARIPRSPEDLAKKAALEAAKHLLRGGILSPVGLWSIFFGTVLFMFVVLIIAILLLFTGDDEAQLPLPPVSEETAALTIEKIGPESVSDNDTTITYTISVRGNSAGEITVIDRIFGDAEYVEATPVPEESDIVKNNDGSLQSVTWRLPGIVTSGDSQTVSTEEVAINKYFGAPYNIPQPNGDSDVNFTEEQMTNANRLGAAVNKIQPYLRKKFDAKYIDPFLSVMWTMAIEGSGANPYTWNCNDEQGKQGKQGISIGCSQWYNSGDWQVGYAVQVSQAAGHLAEDFEEIYGTTDAAKVQEVGNRVIRDGNVTNPAFFPSSFPAKTIEQLVREAGSPGQSDVASNPTTEQRIARHAIALLLMDPALGAVSVALEVAGDISARDNWVATMQSWPGNYYSARWTPSHPEYFSNRIKLLAERYTGASDGTQPPSEDTPSQTPTTETIILRVKPRTNDTYIYNMAEIPSGQ